MPWRPPGSGSISAQCASALGAAMLGALLAAAPARAAMLTRGPYLQLLTPHSVTVVWNTDVASACSLTIRPLDGPAATIAGDTGTVCAIAVDGLVPGGRYAYVPNADGVPLGTESVFHADDPSAPLTMLVFGDSGVPGPGQTAVRDRLLATPADVIVHTGDMIYPGGEAADFDPAFFAPYADLVRQLVLWPCLGNHDFAAAAGQPWRDAFYTPANNPDGSKNYYSFDVGNAHVVVINSNQSTAPGSAQYMFLEHDLAASSAAWKFVVFHHPIYSSGTVHGSSLTIRTNLVPLFDAYAVDMVFMGHEHNYERTLPLRADQVVAPGAGTVYVTTGGGGKNLYPFGPLSFFTAHAESVHHFVRIVVDGDSLTEEMIDVDGTVRDSTTLVKSPGSTPSTTTTSSTTTTTSTSATSGGSTTTSTTRAADACGRRACDDGNRCTLDTCAPGGGCRHEPVDLAALRASIDSEFTVDACVGQPAPVLVTALLRQARGQVEQAAHATSLVRARRLLARALQSLRRSGRRASVAARRGRMSASCAAALGAGIRTAEDRGTCLAPLP